MIVVQEFNKAKTQGGDEMNVAEKLKAYMDDRGLKYSRVAELSGFDRITFSNILNHRRKLSADELVTVCEAGLNIRPEYFFTYKFPKNGNKGKRSLKS